MVKEIGAGDFTEGPTGRCAFHLIPINELPLAKLVAALVAVVHGGQCELRHEAACGIDECGETGCRMNLAPKKRSLVLVVQGCFLPGDGDPVQLG